MKETLIHALEGVARDVSVGAEATGLDKLQVIMTEAKEKVSTSRASARKAVFLASIGLPCPHACCMNKLPRSLESGA